MIKTQTLFILGAGASKPFGYPTGIELRRLILEGRHDASIVKALTQDDDNPKPIQNDLNKFVCEFSKSGDYSIDSFLEYRPEFMDIGKISIAAYLIDFEDDARLRQDNNNWYMYLYDRLKASFDNTNMNKISFITFNYDRSLEQFLFEAIRSRFNKNESECANKMNSIPIVHLYGQLDLLPWQGQNGKEYSQTKDHIVRLRAARENIKLMSRERYNNTVTVSDEFIKAYGLIKNAKRIYFMGFSYDETNLDRLYIYDMKEKIIIGSVKGLALTKQRWIKKYFFDKTQGDTRLLDMDVLSLLQDELQIE